MSHRLEPRAGALLLDPNEVARRLRDEFEHCEIDREQGQDHVGDMLAKLIELNAPQAMIDEVSAGRDRSLQVTVADDSASEDYLTFIVQPNDGILIGYFSAQHEKATRPILERCARALGYQIV